MFDIFGNFLRNDRGNFATLLGVMAVPLMIVAGAATDYARLHTQRSGLQEISDSAALAGAAEFTVANTNKNTIEEVAKAHALSLDPELKVSVVVDESEKEVEVFVAKYWEPLLVHHLDEKAMPIKTSSKAANNGDNSVCILAVDEVSGASISLEGESSIAAESCTVYSNSTSEEGISLDNKAKLEAKSICTAGGYTGNDKNLNVEPTVDCPQVPDPLSNRSFHAKNICDHTDLEINGEDITLHPGTYCGGLSIQNYSDVTLRSGVYQFVDGPFIIDTHAKVNGKFVTFQLNGEDSGLQFTNSSFIGFSAMKSGPTTGILVLADNTVSPDEIIKIQSEDAKEFTGLVYAPYHKVEIGADTKNGDACAKGGIHGPNCKHLPEYCDTSFGHFSDWTAIISKQIEINDGVDLIMNSDYDNSDVPLPSEMGGMRGETRLLH